MLGVAAVAIFGVTTQDVSRLWHGRAEAGVYVALAAGGVLIPIALSELARWWDGSRPRRRIRKVAGLNLAHTIPSGWEHFFLSDRTCFVRVTLNDGRVIAGRFGAESFAGYTAETPDLYLEERWTLDENDWFAGPAAGSLGVYVRAAEIVSVEFYDDGEERLPAPRWWQRLKYLLPWVRMGGYNSGENDSTSTTPDPQDRRDQPVAEGAQPSDPPGST